MSQSSACYLDLGQESVHNAGYTGLPPTYTCLPHVMATQADSASTRYLPAPRHGHSSRFSLHQVLACPTSWPLRPIQPRWGTCLPHVMATQADLASARYFYNPFLFPQLILRGRSWWIRIALKDCFWSRIQRSLTLSPSQGSLNSATGEFNSSSEIIFIPL